MPCYQKVACDQHANITNIDVQVVKKAAVLKSAWPKNVSQEACKIVSIVLRHSKNAANISSGTVGGKGCKLFQNL